MPDLNTMTKNLQNIYDIPDRDKFLLLPYKDKADFVRSFPEMIYARANDYDAYFITFTFSDLKSELHNSYYQEYFRYFRQKLDNALLPNAKHHIKKPLLILVPEAIPKLHFHGILFVHKQTNINFQRKCLLQVIEEYNEILGRDVLSFRLKDKIINPYPRAVKIKEVQLKLIKSQSPKARSSRHKELLHTEVPIVKIADYRIYPLSSSRDYERACGYSVKNFIASRFSYEEIIFEMKDRR